MNPALRALRELGGSASIPELVERVIQILSPTPEVVQQPHGETGHTELEYRLAWARTYLKSFGLITNSDRGVWALTPEGLHVDQVDPREVVRVVRQKHRERKGDKPGPEVTPEGEVEGGEDEAAEWRDRLLQILLEMPPAAFERLCQRLLRESGFIEVEVTGRSGDSASMAMVSFGSLASSASRFSFSPSAIGTTSARQ
jgi:restriction system protein